MTSKLPVLMCSRGHAGPWRFVEAIEVWRDVTAGPDEDGALTVSSQWHTGPGFDEGLAGSGYLLCWHTGEVGHCAERVELRDGTQMVWQ